MDTIIYLFIGLSLGVVAAYLFLKAKHQRLQAEAEFLQKQMSEQKEEARQRIEELKAERLQKEQAMRDDFDRRLALQQKNAEVERRAALEAQATANDVLMASKERSFRQAIEAQEMRHNEAMKAQLVRFDETIEKMTAQLKSATDEMLKQRQKEFEVASNTNLGQIVMPLRETIDKMNRAMNESTIKQTEMLALNIYNTFYGQNTAAHGVAQAKAVIFFILVAGLGLLQLAYTRKKEVQN